MTFADMSYSQEGRLVILKILKADISLLGDEIEKDNTSQIINDIPQIISLLTTIQIGVLTGL